MSTELLTGVKEIILALATLVAAIGAVIGYFKSSKNGKAIEVVDKKVNGQMEKLLEQQHKSIPADEIPNIIREAKKP